MHPKVQFTLVQTSGTLLMEKLIEGGIDLCLSVCGVFEQQRVCWGHLLDGELINAMARTHRLAGRRTLRMAKEDDEHCVKTEIGRSVENGHSLTRSIYLHNIQHESRLPSYHHGMLSPIDR